MIHQQQMPARLFYSDLIVQVNSMQPNAYATIPGLHERSREMWNEDLANSIQTFVLTGANGE
jgi:hypothetical protein